MNLINAPQGKAVPGSVEWPRVRFAYEYTKELSDLSVVVGKIMEALFIKVIQSKKPLEQTDAETFITTKYRSELAHFIKKHQAYYMKTFAKQSKNKAGKD